MSHHYRIPRLCLSAMGLVPAVVAAASPVEEWIAANPRVERSEAESPTVRDNREPRIPPEQREALGLPAPRWVASSGKAHPSVAEAFAEQGRRKTEMGAMFCFQGDRPTGFQHTAYVAVYLRHESAGPPGSTERQVAIRAVQQRILTRLTAAEFSLFHAFRDTAGLVGYVNDSGLRKLLDDADVLAICIDDQPRPQDPPPVTHAEPQRDAAGKPVWSAPAEQSGKVETGVYEAMRGDRDRRAFVNVSIAAVRDIPWTSDKHQIAEVEQTKILATLSASEFRLRYRMPTSGFSGFVDARGLRKLEQHPAVSGVGLPLPPIRVSAPGRLDRGRPR